jgi:3-phosphoshikimate 1-carboxyvinyltransferase
MAFLISKPAQPLKATITVAASKSISNRFLIIRALCESEMQVENLSDSDDTRVLSEILEQVKQNPGGNMTFDVSHAGTTMRFLTAYLATQPGEWILTGSDRMQKRPIRILVEALKMMGAQIEYMGEEGFPPLKIYGVSLKGGEIEVAGHISSQFVSALLLSSVEFHHGLVIDFVGEVVSRPYINMTLKMMENFGVYGQWQGNRISVSKQRYDCTPEKNVYTVEADWTSASYWYAIAALSDKPSEFLLKNLKKTSVQGDALVADLFTFFGVNSQETEDGLKVVNTNRKTVTFCFDFSDCPDIVQTVAVVAAAKKVHCIMNGLSTLRHKETDRIAALQQEIRKLGAELKDHGDGSYELIPGDSMEELTFKTYDDHRMALSFATLAAKFDGVKIENPEVVSKSYPGFWDQLKDAGFQVTEA